MSSNTFHRTAKEQTDIVLGNIAFVNEINARLQSKSVQIPKPYDPYEFKNPWHGPLPPPLNTSVRKKIVKNKLCPSCDCSYPSDEFEDDICHGCHMDWIEHLSEYPQGM